MLHLCRTSARGCLGSSRRSGRIFFVAVLTRGGACSFPGASRGCHCTADGECATPHHCAGARAAHTGLDQRRACMHCQIFCAVRGQGSCCLRCVHGRLTGGWQDIDELVLSPIVEIVNLLEPAAFRGVVNVRFCPPPARPLDELRCAAEFEFRCSRFEDGTMVDDLPGLRCGMVVMCSSLLRESACRGEETASMRAAATST
jgi:hypothetical protein